MRSKVMTSEQATSVYAICGVNKHNARSYVKTHSLARKTARKELYNSGISVSDIAMLEHHLFGLKPDHSRIWHSVNDEIINRVKPVNKQP
jgi:hypothetical protein